MPKPLLFHLLLVFLPALAAQSQPREGKDYALFFAVTDFDHWQDFPSGTADQVRQIAEELKGNYGYQVETILNPTRKTILDKLTNDYGKRLFAPKDQLLVYFSLHGHYEEGGTGALIPKDGKLQDPTYDSWITHPILEDLLNRIPCEHITLALDACYSGTFGPEYRSKPETPAWETADDCAAKTANALRYKSRLYLTSGGVERTPTTSQFADKWLEALRLRNTDGLLGFHELFDVLSEANPRPMFGDFRGHVKGGDFVFMHSKACAAAPVVSDAAHWAKTAASPSQEALLEHLRLFPKCTHEPEVINLLKGPAPNLPFDPKGASKTDENPPPDNMVKIIGGTFQMGDNDGNYTQKPVHTVTLSDFYIGRHEVTVEEFSRFVEATGYKTDAEKTDGSSIFINGYWQEHQVGINWRHNATGTLRPANEYNHPVAHVSWNDAIAYCNWLSAQHGYQTVYRINVTNVTADWTAEGYRLPTEAEWEYAARSQGGSDKWAGTSSETNLTSFANYNKTQDDFEFTTPVGSFKPNTIGLYDMCGNVWELCWDWYGDYLSYAQTNPRGPASGSNRVIRGGSWDSSVGRLRCTNRSIGGDPANRNGHQGFRLSRAAR